MRAKCLGQYLAFSGSLQACTTIDRAGKGQSEWRSIGRGPSRLIRTIINTKNDTRKKKEKERKRIDSPPPNCNSVIIIIVYLGSQKKKNWNCHFG